MNPLKVLLIGSSGYVGSYLESYLPDQIDLILWTCDVVGSSQNSPAGHFPMSHEEIPKEELAMFDLVLFFAGCSSVGMARSNPFLAVKQNVAELVSLRSKLRKDQWLIYASSGSVYSQELDQEISAPSLSFEDSKLPKPTNIYDSTKQIADILLGSGDFGKCTGLRLGTVSGFSPKLRQELVFNSMVYSAATGKKVTLSNPGAWRSILFLEDLGKFLIGFMKLTGNEPPTIVNLASFTMTFESMAKSITQYFGAGLEVKDPTPTYSFRLDTSLSEQYFQASDKSLESHMEELRGKIVQ